MIGIVHIVCGAKQRGKTTFVKQILNRFINPAGTPDIFVYDINNEYKNYYKNDFESIEDFFFRIKNTCNSLIIFEEATIFFQHTALIKPLLDKLVRTRHQHNYIILNFHSLRKVPVNIIDLADYLTLFKTNDELNFISQKFKGNVNLINKFIQVQQAAEYHINITHKLNI